ncbi:unnamed protein product [Protopolystoma xenopodis]|uniref:Uncharacterized protein n=1 Tax=Protopolystoma xenopodis TaxID=117903 RepID=A0A448X8N4_9PLAT|nr:unnamed protein product [Protopolystoma xenopodis]
MSPGSTTPSHSLPGCHVTCPGDSLLTGPGFEPIQCSACGETLLLLTPGGFSPPAAQLSLSPHQTGSDCELHVWASAKAGSSVDVRRLTWQHQGTPSTSTTSVSAPIGVAAATTYWAAEDPSDQLVGLGPSSPPPLDQTGWNSLHRTVGGELSRQSCGPLANGQRDISDFRCLSAKFNEKTSVDRPHRETEPSADGTDVQALLEAAHVNGSIWIALPSYILERCIKLIIRFLPSSQVILNYFMFWVILRLVYQLICHTHYTIWKISVYLTLYLEWIAVLIITPLHMLQFFL